MYIRLLLTLTIVLFSYLLSAQTNNSANKISGKNDTTFTGTYQIQVINSRDNPNIPANLKELVLNNRDEKKRVSIMLGDVVRLLILPQTEIKQTGFKPLKQIAYVSE